MWRGTDSDPDLYMSLQHEGCPLINPINAITREDLPQFFEAVLAVEPDIHVEATRWAVTDDGVLFEWVNTGTLADSPLEIRGADRCSRGLLLLRPTALPRGNGGARVAR